MATVLTLDANRLTHDVFAAKFPKAADSAKSTMFSDSKFGRQVSQASTELGRQVSQASAASSETSTCSTTDWVEEAPAGLLCGASAVSGWLTYAAPAKADRLAQLREAVEDEDWDAAFATGQTMSHAKPSWSCSVERCNALRSMCMLNGAKRVLEIGSFVGAGALALAEAVPLAGDVVALEVDPYFVEFGRRYIQQTDLSQKITTMTGPAVDSLKLLAKKVKSGAAAPFDVVVIDADKTNMQLYFDFLWDNGLLVKQPVICVDMTPFKGQIPARYARFGSAAQCAEFDSGEVEIKAFRKAMKQDQGFTTHEYCGVMVIQRARN